MFRLACVIAVLVVTLYCTDHIPSYLVVFLGSIIYLVTGGWKWLKLLSQTFRRDVYVLIVMSRVIYQFIRMAFKKTSLRDLLYTNVRRHPNKLAFVDADTDNSLTFKEIEQLSHKIANVFYEAGYRKGDVVALYMENRVEYMSICLGLSMIGVITSLINYNLRGDSLRHCIDVCNCKSIIFSEITNGSLKDIRDDLKVQLYCFDTCESTPISWISLGTLMPSASSLPPPGCPEIKSSDTIMYMYTSGTTGLPKAVIITVFKVLSIACASFTTLLGITENDIFYVALPLYHSNGWFCTNACFFRGCTTIIKKRFSASQYIADCYKHKVTVVNYIGEICRYILCQPKASYDELNSIRLAIGNGLRASIWMEFKERFKIEKVIEVYGATEGNFALFPNTEGRVGAVGFKPLLLPNYDVKLVKMDKETNEILRDAKGLALEAEIGVPGQAVGKITKFAKFDGYTNKEATKKKIAHNIFSHGDSAFLTGDMLVKDEEGYYYFRDRTGDTFRWKGENVSTNEVEGLISKVTELTDVCVYGVHVPGNEGKAGMACIVDPHKKINVEDLPKAFDQLLPRYAQPHFLRLSQAVDVTGTFKFQKNKLREEGYVPGNCSDGDKLYYLNKKENKFLLLDCNVYEEITRESISF